MARVNVFDHDEMTGEDTLAGYFDIDKARRIKEGKDWDGNNNRGRISGLQIGFEWLYRTAGGRWVVYHYARNEFNGPEYFRYLTDAAARDWLLRNESDAIVEQYFGEIPEETGPPVGRPEIGPAVNIRFPQGTLDELKTRADTEGISRAELVRRYVAEALESVPTAG